MPQVTVVTKYTQDDLEHLPTRCVGQCCNLKIDADQHRVWLCRVGGGVSVETLSPRGNWVTTSGSCYAEFAYTEENK